MKNLFRIVFSETDELMEHSLDDSLQSNKIFYVDEKSKMAITAGKCLINRSCGKVVKYLIDRNYKL